MWSHLYGTCLLHYLVPFEILFVDRSVIHNNLPLFLNPLLDDRHSAQHPSKTIEFNHT